MMRSVIVHLRLNRPSRSCWFCHTSCALHPGTGFLLSIGVFFHVVGENGSERKGRARSRLLFRIFCKFHSDFLHGKCPLSDYSRLLYHHFSGISSCYCAKGTANFSTDLIRFDLFFRGNSKFFPLLQSYLSNLHFSIAIFILHRSIKYPA